MDLRYERLEVLLLLTGAWTGLFLLLRYVLCKARSALFSNRLVSFLHAFVAIYFTFVALDLRHPFKDYGTRSKPLEVGQSASSLRARSCPCWLFPEPVRDPGTDTRP